jgi:hypothetical protein
MPTLMHAMRTRSAANAGNKLLRHTEDFAAQLTLQGLSLQNLQANYSKTVGAVIDTSPKAGADATQAAGQVVELAYNMTKDSAFALAVRDPHLHCI